MDIITKSANETSSIGSKVVSDIVAIHSNTATVLALSGDLGSGKTTFVSGLAHDLGIKSRIVSPTFVISKEYAVSSEKLPTIHTLVHVDAYRLDDPSKLDDSVVHHLNELWNQSGYLIVIEWAENISKFIPKFAVWLSFSYINDTDRKIQIIKNHE
jgi:tRNA threonylcarbamoyladenosine biosynthesis protein TsaE